MIGYKAVCLDHKFSVFRDVCISHVGIAKLEIPDTSYVVISNKSHIFRGRFPGSTIDVQYRTNRAKVLDICDFCGNSYKGAVGISWYDSHFVYIIGDTITSDSFCACPWVPCDHGIHFYKKFNDAVTCAIELQGRSHPTCAPCDGTKGVFVYLFGGKYGVQTKNIEVSE